MTGADHVAARSELAPFSGTGKVPRILVVEDNIDVARALEFRLRKKGYDTLLVYDGRAGLEAAKRFEPDVMILDIRMPVMSGIAVLAELSKAELIDNISIIVLSANVADESKHRAKELGAQYYLEKPYEATKLLELVSAALLR